MYSTVAKIALFFELSVKIPPNSKIWCFNQIQKENSSFEKTVKTKMERLFFEPKSAYLLMGRESAPKNTVQYYCIFHFETER